MSHEGIRIVSADEQRRALAAEQALPPAAITPAKVRIALTEGTGMDITWKDGHRSHWSFPFLRDACPCATCNEEREADGRRPGERKAATPGIFPIFTPPARPTEATPVGRYAIRFRWNDGHESGIYAFDYLRRLDMEAALNASDGR